MEIKKTTYTVGDTQLILEDISCIGKAWGEDANRICVQVWLRGAKEPMKCTYIATGKQVHGQSDAHDTEFMRGAYGSIEKFITDWRLANN